MTGTRSAPNWNRSTRSCRQYCRPATLITLYLKKEKKPPAKDDLGGPVNGYFRKTRIPAMAEEVRVGQPYLTGRSSAEAVPETVPIHHDQARR